MSHSNGNNNNWNSNSKNHLPPRNTESSSNSSKSKNKFKKRDNEFRQNQSTRSSQFHQNQQMFSNFSGPSSSNFFPHQNTNTSMMNIGHWVPGVAQDFSKPPPPTGQLSSSSNGNYQQHSYGFEGGGALGSQQHHQNHMCFRVETTNDMPGLMEVNTNLPLDAYYQCPDMYSSAEMSGGGAMVMTDGMVGSGQYGYQMHPPSNFANADQGYNSNYPQQQMNYHPNQQQNYQYPSNHQEENYPTPSPTPHRNSEQWQHQAIMQMDYRYYGPTMNPTYQNMIAQPNSHFVMQGPPAKPRVEMGGSSSSRNFQNAGKTSDSSLNKLSFTDVKSCSFLSDIKEESDVKLTEEVFVEDKSLASVKQEIALLTDSGVVVQEEDTQENSSNKKDYDEGNSSSDSNVKVENDLIETSTGQSKIVVETEKLDLVADTNNREETKDQSENEATNPKSPVSSAPKQKKQDKKPPVSSSTRSQSVTRKIRNQLRVLNYQARSAKYAMNLNCQDTEVAPIKDIDSPLISTTSDKLIETNIIPGAEIAAQVLDEKTKVVPILVQNDETIEESKETKIEPVIGNSTASTDLSDPVDQEHSKSSELEITVKKLVGEVLDDVLKQFGQIENEKLIQDDGIQNDNGTETLTAQAASTPPNDLVEKEEKSQEVGEVEHTVSEDLVNPARPPEPSKPISSSKGPKKTQKLTPNQRKNLAKKRKKAQRIAEMEEFDKMLEQEVIINESMVIPPIVENIEEPEPISLDISETEVYKNARRRLQKYLRIDVAHLDKRTIAAATKCVIYTEGILEFRRPCMSLQIPNATSPLFEPIVTGISEQIMKHWFLQPLRKWNEFDDDEQIYKKFLDTKVDLYYVSREARKQKLFFLFRAMSFCCNSSLFDDVFWLKDNLQDENKDLEYLEMFEKEVTALATEDIKFKWPTLKQLQDSVHTKLDEGYMSYFLNYIHRKSDERWNIEPATLIPYSVHSILKLNDNHQIKKSMWCSNDTIEFLSEMHDGLQAMERTSEFELFEEFFSFMFEVMSNIVDEDAFIMSHYLGFRSNNILSHKIMFRTWFGYESGNM